MTPRTARSRVGTSSRGLQAGRTSPSLHWRTCCGVVLRGARRAEGSSARATTQQAASAASAGRMPRYVARAMRGERRWT